MSPPAALGVFPPMGAWPPFETRAAQEPSDERWARQASFSNTELPALRSHLLGARLTGASRPVRRVCWNWGTFRRSMDNVEIHNDRAVGPHGSGLSVPHEWYLLHSTSSSCCHANDTHTFPPACGGPGVMLTVWATFPSLPYLTHTGTQADGGAETVTLLGERRGERRGARGRLGARVAGPAQTH